MNIKMTSCMSAHLAQYLFPVLSPQNDSDHSQQQQDDAHQAANQNSCITAVVLGDRKACSGSHGCKFRPCRRKIKDEM